MKIGSVEVTLHRTVRVAEGRAPSNLPPSLGRMRTFSVKDYRQNCPASWEDDAVFVALHKTEAMWMSFRSAVGPVALLVGAGGVNALTGEKLGTKLEKDNYCVAPPQPWLDGWKDQDGTVYQFVAATYEGGKGVTVGEQILGEESKTGGIGIAVFEPLDRSKLKLVNSPHEMYGDSAFGDVPHMSFTGSFMSKSLKSSNVSYASCSVKPSSLARGMALPEMGVGKGGKIVQKIYPDPYGVEVWQESPTAVSAIYLVDAAIAEQITGEKVATPVASENYPGNWFGLGDQEMGDVEGSSKFTGLKSAVFAGDTSNVAEEK